MKADILAEELGIRIGEEPLLKHGPMFEISRKHILCLQHDK